MNFLKNILIFVGLFKPSMPIVAAASNENHVAESVTDSATGTYYRGVDFCFTTADMKLHSITREDASSVKPKFYVSAQELREIKETGDRNRLKLLMEKGLEHIKEDLKRPYMLRVVFADATLNNYNSDGFLSQVADTICQNFLGLDSSKQAARKLVYNIVGAKLHGKDFRQTVSSDVFYNEIAQIVIIPQITQVFSNPGFLEGIFNELFKLDLTNEKPEELEAEFNAINKISSPYDDLNVKKALFRGQENNAVNRGVDIVLSYHRPHEDPTEDPTKECGRLNSADGTLTLHFSDNCRSSGRNTKRSAMPEVFSHEIHHAYDAIGVNCPIIGLNSQFPCGNNRKQIPGFRNKLNTALAYDIDGLDRELRIRSNHAGAIVDPELGLIFKILLQTYRVTGGVGQPIYDRTGNLDHSEILTHVTQHIYPVELLRYAPNLAYTRSFTIHDDGRPETRLYTNLMQGNYNAVRSILKQDPKVLDSKYDGIPLIDVARLFENSSPLINQNVRVGKTGEYKRTFALVNETYNNITTDKESVYSMEL